MSERKKEERERRIDKSVNVRYKKTDRVIYRVASLIIINVPFPSNNISFCLGCTLTNLTRKSQPESRAATKLKCMDIKGKTNDNKLMNILNED